MFAPARLAVLAIALVAVAPAALAAEVDAAEFYNKCQSYAAMDWKGMDEGLILKCKIALARDGLANDCNKCHDGCPDLNLNTAEDLKVASLCHAKCEASTYCMGASTTPTVSPGMPTVEPYSSSPASTSSERCSDCRFGSYGTYCTADQECKYFCFDSATQMGPGNNGPHAGAKPCGERGSTMATKPPTVDTTGINTLAELKDACLAAAKINYLGMDEEFIQKCKYYFGTVGVPVPQPTPMTKCQAANVTRPWIRFSKHCGGIVATMKCECDKYGTTGLVWACRTGALAECPTSSPAPKCPLTKCEQGYTCVEGKGCVKDQTPLCCKAEIASCLACAVGKTVKEYCVHKPNTLGCPLTTFPPLKCPLTKCTQGYTCVEGKGCVEDFPPLKCPLTKCKQGYTCVEGKGCVEDAEKCSDKLAKQQAADLAKMDSILKDTHAAIKDTLHKISDADLDIKQLEKSLKEVEEALANKAC